MLARTRTNPYLGDLHFKSRGSVSKGCLIRMCSIYQRQIGQIENTMVNLGLPLNITDRDLAVN